MRSSGKPLLNVSEDVTINKDTTINVKQKFYHRACRITGCVRTNDHTIAVADFKNSSVKLVDLNRKKVKDRLSLKSKPWDITRVNEHTLAVTCPGGRSRYIQLVTVSKSGCLTLGQEIPVNGLCVGIRYTATGGGIFLVSFTNPHKVKVMDTSGTVLKDLSLDAAGQPRFVMPYHIGISNDGSTLIVSNHGTNTVKGLTLDGAVKWVYSDDELWQPAGVAVGDGGEIYVCGYASFNIHVISSEGRKIKVLLKKNDGVECPQCVTFCDNKLFVGSKKNHLDVYRIQYQ